MKVSWIWNVLRNSFQLNLLKSLITLPHSLHLSFHFFVILKSPLIVQIQTIGKVFAIIYHRYCHLVWMLGTYTYVSTMVPPRMPSNLIPKTPSSYNAPYIVTNLVKCFEGWTPMPPFLATLRFIQLWSSNGAARLQHVYFDMSLYPTFSSDMPLSLYFCIMTILTLSVNVLRKHLSFSVLSGSLRPCILWSMIVNFVDEVGC